jgi:biotin carboxyl carrier protein
MAATYRLSLNGTAHEVSVEEGIEGLIVTIDGERMHADLKRISDPVYSLLLEGLSFEIVVQERPDECEVVIGNRSYTVETLRPGQAAAGAAASEVQVKAPMTGRVVEVPVQAGESVAAGQTIAIIESMKMNNEIRSPRDGTVRDVRIKPGERVERNTVIAVIG